MVLVLIGPAWAKITIMDPVNPGHHVPTDDEWVPLHATTGERAAIVELSTSLYQRWQDRWIAGKATLTHKATTQDMLR